MNQERRMAKNKKAQKAGTQEQAARRLDRIRTLALTPGVGEDLPDQLFEDVAWLVARGRDRAVSRLLADLALPEEGRDVLELALEEAGYRLPAVLKNQDGSFQPGWLIPFALLTVLTVGSRPSALPVGLSQDAIDRLTEGRLLRQVLRVGEDPLLVIDGRLYRIDHEAWLRPSVVRSYLERVLWFGAGLAGGVPPLFRSSPDPPGWTVLQRMESGQLVFVAIRALIGGALAPEGEPAIRLEERLFGETLPPEAFHPIEGLLAGELEAAGCQPVVPPSLIGPVELYDVPATGLDTNNAVLAATMDLDLETVHDRIERLWEAIDTIPGPRRLELSLFREAFTTSLLLDEQGRTGLLPQEEAIFHAQLEQAALTGGGLLVLQHLRPEPELPGAPTQAVYGVRLQEGHWIPLSAAEVRTVLFTDPDTGRLRPPEPGVSCRTFPVIR